MKARWRWTANVADALQALIVTLVVVAAGMLLLAQTPAVGILQSPDRALGWSMVMAGLLAAPYHVFVLRSLVKRDRGRS